MDLIHNDVTSHNNIIKHNARRNYGQENSGQEIVGKADKKNQNDHCEKVRFFYPTKVLNIT